LEQSFLVNTIMGSRFWKSTAIIVLYDDSDGWYDHQMSPIINSGAVATASTSNSDQLKVKWHRPCRLMRSSAPL